jgi:multiple sugar transport system permease protein/sn-glycerol 3-phosphate transport system permease protein
MAPYLLVFPALFILFVFVLLPLILAIVFSLADWDLLSVEVEWVALDNYIRLFQDREFWQAIENTLVFTGVMVPVTVALAVALAVLLDTGVRGIRLFRTMMFVPYLTPMAAISTLWVWMFDQHFGIINWALGSVGWHGIPWLTRPGWAMAALIIMKIWKVTGYYAILLLAGLQNIPPSLLEAASIDGAGRLRVFLRITLPLLSPYVLFVVVIAVISAFQNFDQIYMMTRGGPAGNTTTIIYYLYQYGFEFFEVGYASSVALLLFVLLFALTWLQFAVSRKWVHYG